MARIINPTQLGIAIITTMQTFLGWRKNLLVTWIPKSLICFSLRSLIWWLSSRRNRTNQMWRWLWTQSSSIILWENFWLTDFRERLFLNIEKWFGVKFALLQKLIKVNFYSSYTSKSVIRFSLRTTLVSKALNIFNIAFLMIRFECKVASSIIILWNGT